MGDLRGVLTLVVGVLLATPASAIGARLEILDLPSRLVDATTANFNAGGALKATVRLPDGYDRRRAYPLLLLLHGVGDTHRTWAAPGRGDILETAKGLDAIVVMPDAARGFYTDWWNGGLRGDPAWESYFLGEVLPAIRSRYRIRAGRRWHAVAGLSMGGLGATFLGGRAPGYFGSVSSFSGFLDHQRLEIHGGGLEAAAGVDYETIFGPPEAFYATGHNPERLAGNLSRSRVYAAAGDGTVDPALGTSSPSAATTGGAVEAGIRMQNDAFAAAARAAGVPLTYAPHAGVHDWPYWRSDLRAAIAHGLFVPVPERPRRWANTTVARSGDLFGVRYAFAAPPEDLVRFERDGDVLRVTGPDARVTITTPGGCAAGGRLPLKVDLGGDPCARLRPRVRPRRVRPGRRTLLRVRTGMPGARVRAGRVRARADDAGLALVRSRFTWPRARRIVATHPDRRPGRVRVRVRG